MNAAGQLTNWVVSSTNGWSMSRALGYDAGSRIVTQKFNSAVSTNIYDLTDQLLSSSGSFSHSATCDALSNRVTADAGTYTMSGNGLNQYASISTSGSLTYDANGCVAGWNGWALSHDSQGQLVYMEKHTDDGWFGLILDYDYRGLRIDDWDYDYTGHGIYVYDARGNLLQKREQTTGWQTQYAYADGIDKAVLLRAGDASGTNLYALVTDQLGTVVAILDNQGNLVETYDYTSFGKTTI